MSQTYNENIFQVDHNVGTDMQNIENNFAALRSSFSGASAPANPEPGLLYFDTTKKLLRVRNQADSAWLGVLQGSTSFKVWVYANSAEDGWVVDGSITDKVLAIKGGTQAYNVAGGNTAGTWTQPSHTLTEDEIPSHDHSISESNVQIHSHSGGGVCQAGGSPTLPTPGNTNNSQHNHGIVADEVGGDQSHNHGITYRPNAAVGTLQYPNN